jgi:hypothetical protein
MLTTEEKQVKKEVKKTARLVDRLNNKADVYYNGSRVYTFETPFSIDGIFLVLRGQAVDPDKLTDGHGRTITA